ncbi:hypothetical protein O6H91_06G001100 [Diphasiastrum complanatum]|uniref:Uncharacterized protein n=1 Tax=Diphasiastrum complanatum TaxID=34168 RepID=A0ACC2DAB2_DIPCM|nr:hypothetical protein O6H91_06G001100 [Diphasiastrum complanatum]
MAMAAPPLHLCYLSWSSSTTFQSPSPLFLPQYCSSHNSKEPLLPFALEVCAGRRNHSDSMKLQQGKGWSNRRHGDLKDLEHHVKDQLKNNLIVGGRSAVKLESLRIDQAIGQVMTAQANFMRVIVENAGQDAACTSIMHSRGDDISCESSVLSDEQVKTLDSSHSGYGGAAEHVKYIVDGDNIAALDSCSLVGHGNFQRHAVDDKGTFNIENVAIDAVNDEGITNLVNVSVDAERTREPKSGRELLCVVRAVLKKIKRKVMVGDRVLVSGIDWTAGRGMVEDVFARKSQIIDPPVANVDHLLVLFAMDKPRLDPMTLSRFLVEAESTRINFTLVLNKVDLVPSKVAQMWEERLSCWGYKPIFCSAETHAGIDSLVPLLKDRTSVVVGPSGVGKSSLINSFRNEGSKESFLDERFTSFAANYVADKLVFAGIAA